MKNALPAIGCLIWFAVGTIQLFAIYGLFHSSLGWGWFLSGVSCLFLAYIPLVGMVMGILGAVKAWGWSLPGALGLFLGPYLLIILLALLAGMLEKKKS